MKVHISGQTFDFDPEALDNFDLMDIEDATGLATIDWQEALFKGSGRALTALVWILRRRTEVGLAYADVRFKLNELVLEEDEESGKEDGASPVASETS